MRWFMQAVVPCLLAATLLAGCASTPMNNSLGDAPRSVVMTHYPSGETISVTYWQPGGYDSDALREIAVLFRDRRTGEVVPIDPVLIDLLVELRQRCGAPADAPIRLTSGYRSAASNAALARSNPNVAENSYHMRGQAADFSIAGVPPACLGEAAAAMRRGGYAVYPHTGHVHIDTGPFRTWTPKGPEPRTQPVTIEARAGREKTAARSELASLPPPSSDPPQVPPPTAAPPAAAMTAPAPRRAGRDASPRTAVAKVPAPPDLSRVRMVLTQLKEQPAPPAKDRKKSQP